MNDVTNLKDTIVAKSSQLNADDLIAGSMQIKITSVKRGDSKDQPIDICFEGDDGKPFKPCKTLRKLLVFAWGENGNDWIGKSAVLYRDANVKWGGVAVGGIRISHLSHIDRDISLSLAETKGKKSTVNVKRLVEQEPPAAPAVTDAEIEVAVKQLGIAANSGMAALGAEWGKLSAPIKKSLGKCPDSLKAVAAAVDEQAAAPEQDNG